MRRYTSKKYTYTPTQGVKSDFETLLQRFTETGTVRFSNFSEIWREMNFSKYCAGRQTLREAREVNLPSYVQKVPFKVLLSKRLNTSHVTRKLVFSL